MFLYSVIFASAAPIVTSTFHLKIVSPREKSPASKGNLTRNVAPGAIQNTNGYWGDASRGVKRPAKISSRRPKPLAKSPSKRPKPHAKIPKPSK
ncbi:hypothetical protein CROQUDRAFT_654715 [Cronartium quercuum f. sp. fusiforme G11]|uniref:Uncharacterized protein n=1 Tax=Cronartium quercuum f. sp. fusiforme G11 TaxID=708437 RepID=A0A9P6TE98_9BASI|nr:hypothetical protein CROQUDRAFT_654715 [Cronartium quercuum f. sp. fusiforme G11]